MPDENFRPSLSIFGVAPNDPGYIYIIENGRRYKIGKTKSKTTRIRAAKTWLPDMQLVGIKPFWNVGFVEKCIHVGFAHSWYDGEWFEPLDEGYRETIVDHFREFSDTDRDRNSIEFIYWFNGDGMAELVNESFHQKLTPHRFIRQESEVKKKR
ncbi:MAG: GIY-YIG nuclease family protein [Alphaproteobacteria bacterium]|nr:GIY-YIG nuclease family protein [Alphaproteobacteria bacterium]